MERSLRFGGILASGQHQLLGKGAWLGPVPTGLLGSGKGVLCGVGGLLASIQSSLGKHM